MRKRRKTRFAELLLFIIISTNQLIGQAFLLHHTPPFSGVEGNPLVLKAAPITEVGLLDAKLYYRIPGNSSFIEQDFTKFGFYYQTIIPEDKLTLEGLEYLIAFRFENGSLASFPNRDPFKNPHQLNVKKQEISVQQFGQPSLIKPADVLILSPEPESIIGSKEVLIALSFFNTPDVDMKAIQLILDGRNVTEKAIIEDGILSYNPLELLKGLHQVECLLQDTDGRKMMPVSWNFTIGYKDQKLSEIFEYKGRLGSRVSTEKVGNTVLNVSEMTGNIELDVKWSTFKGDFRITSRESEFRQPQNRLGSSFQLGRFIKMEMGDFNPVFTPFTIDGKRVRGFSFDADLNFIRFQYISGELNRAVQHTGSLDSGYRLLPQMATTDSTGLNRYVLDRKGYMFERNIIATRLSIDLWSKFKAGIHLLQVRDNSNSIRAEIPNISFEVDTSIVGVESGFYTFNELNTIVMNLGDSLYLPDKGWQSGDPKDNLVMGFNLGRTFDQKKLSFDFNWNLSLYNRNIWEGAMSRAEMDTALDDSLDGIIGLQYKDGKPVSGGVNIDTSKIFIDPIKYEKLFIINTSMSPLVPIDITSIKSHPISTIINMPSSAFNLKLKGHYARNNFLVEYRQVGPKYVSLGNPFLFSNVREFSIQDRISLLDHQLFITAGFKHRDNKILKTVVNPLSTNIFSLNLNFMMGPGAPSFMLNYQSIGKNNHKTEKDSVGGELVDLREYSSASNNMISVTLPFSAGTVKHTAMLSYSGITNKDKLSGKRGSGYLFPKTDTKTISMNISSTYSSPLRSILNFSRTELYIPIQSFEGIEKIPYTWTSAALTGHYVLRQDLLKFIGNFSFLNSKGAVHSQVFGIRLGGDYRIRQNLLTVFSGTFMVNRFPSYNADEIDNDGNGKVDEAGESLQVNTTGIILTIKYNF